MIQIIDGITISQQRRKKEFFEKEKKIHRERHQNDAKEAAIHTHTYNNFFGSTRSDNYVQRLEWRLNYDMACTNESGSGSPLSSM